MSWITILIALLPEILKILQMLFPPKTTVAIGPFQKRLVARAAARMQVFIDSSKAAGYITDGSIAEAKAADDELAAIFADS